MNNFTSLCDEPNDDDGNISSVIDPSQSSVQNVDLPVTFPPTVENPQQPIRSRNTRPGTLRDLLEKDTHCRAIVIRYDTHNSLTKALRNRLVRFIIKLEIEKSLSSLGSGDLLSDLSISTAKFEFYANEIHKTFPREVPSTYYTPFHSENGVTTNAAGKLWWHFDYSKQRLFNDGVLKRRGTRTNESVTDSAPLSSCVEELETLRTILCPWADVMKLWSETFTARRAILIDNHVSVQNYLQKFACLRSSKALSLFETDFAILHPNAAGKLQACWDLVTDHLIELINALTIRDLSFSALQVQLDTADSGLKTGILLSLLPYLIPPRRPGRKRRNARSDENEPPVPRTLSFAERKEAFFLHISTIVDLEAVLSTGIQHTSRLALQHHPVPIIVGPFDNVAACYVILENTLYESESVLHAFESTIQMCYALNCKYPLNSRSVWIFLQQAFLRITETADKPSNEVVALIGAVQAIIDEVQENTPE